MRTRRDRPDDGRPDRLLDRLPGPTAPSRRGRRRRRPGAARAAAPAEPVRCPASAAPTPLGRDVGQATTGGHGAPRTRRQDAKQAEEPRRSPARSRPSSPRWSTSAATSRPARSTHRRQHRRGDLAVRARRRRAARRRRSPSPGSTPRRPRLSDGTKGDPGGRAGYGTMTIAGQEFSIGPDGVEGGGQAQPIPGLPDEPDAGARAARRHDHRARADVRARRRQGGRASVAGLVVEIDTAKLRADARRRCRSTTSSTSCPTRRPSSRACSARRSTCRRGS